MSTPARNIFCPGLFLLPLFGLLCTGFLHAGGCTEDVLMNASLDTAGKKDLLIRACPAPGCLEFEVRGLQSLEEGIDCAGLWYRQGGSTWHMERNGSPCPAALPGLLAAMVDVQGLPLSPLPETRIIKGQLSSSPVLGLKEGLGISGFQPGLFPLDRNNPMFRESRDRIGFSLGTQGRSGQSGVGPTQWTWDATCWLILGNTARGTATVLVSKLDLEFFEGEREFLEQSVFPSSMPMTHRTLSLLWAVLADSYDNAGRSGEFNPSAWRDALATGFADSPWFATANDFPSLTVLQTLWHKKAAGQWPSDLQTGIDRFKSALLANLLHPESTLQGLFSRNSLQVQFFLRLCLGANKPFSSRDYADRYKNLRETEGERYPASMVLPREFRFDYRNYRSINPHEGIKLAQAASKYLAWGIQAPQIKKALETLMVKARAERGNPGAYPELQFLKLVDDWLEKAVPGLEAWQESNYFRGPIQDLGSVPDSPLPPELLVLLESQLGENSPDGPANPSLGVPAEIRPGALASSPFGVDSPRTWAYKLLKYMEYQARWNAIPHNPTPFEPPFTEYRNKSSSQPLGQCMGVDSLGFLGGCMAMAGLGRQFPGFGNLAKLQALESYFRFAPDSRLGRLQLDGMPASIPGVNARALGSSALAAALKANDAEYRRDSNRLRLSALDLESSTILLPDPGMARIGDLVCQTDSPDPDSMRIGIIAAIKGTLSRDDSLEDIFSRILVISPGSSGPLSRINMNFLDSAGAASTFTPARGKFSLRRLLVRRASAPPAENDRYPYEPWDFITTRAESFAVDPECLDESGNKNRGWRWIPDTGEYLAFEVKVSGMYPNRIKSRPMNQALRFLAPRDRNWTPAQTESNVDNNQGSGFEIVALEGHTAHPIVAFTKRNGSDGDTQYRLDYAWAPGKTSEAYDSSGKARAGWVIGVDESGRLALQTPRGSFARFGIRPLDPGSFAPGDDLILRFCPESGFDAAAGRPLAGNSPVCASESSWMATYDKKLLWRANLYIDEGPETDWNNLHPWAAPPGPVSMANNVPSGGIPWWARKADGGFDEVWGYNEWNRSWDGNGESGSGFAGLTALGAGDGRQVISLPAFTPLRTLGGSTDSPDPGNVISGTVAYSYPYHRHEPFQADQNTAGDAGSQDSPFDFVKKMLMQKQDLAYWYNEKGERFARPRTSWPDPEAVSPSQFPDQNSWLNNARFLLPAEMADFTAWQARNTGRSWHEYPAIANFSLKSWDKTQAPENSWWHYQTRAADNWDKSKPTRNFMPGLGLKIVSHYGLGSWKPSDSWDEKAHLPDPGLGTDSIVNAEHVIEAGTDCIGFAQRAMSWKFNSSTSPSIKNAYKWEKLDNGIAEVRQGAGDDNIWWVFGTADQRRFPVPGGSQPEAATTIVHTLPGHEPSTFIKSDSWTETEKAAALKLLKKVVPGDIWVKDSGDTNTLWDNHIAIIAQVPEKPETYTDPQKYMLDMILIEAEFANKIQSVINKLSVGDYNRGDILNNFPISNYFTTPNDLNESNNIPNEKINLNCKSWSIRRLK